MWDYEPNKKGDKLGEKVLKNPDIVNTNPEMAKHLISLIKYETGDTFCDPCKGPGAFYDNFPTGCEKIYYEINEQRDYLGEEKRWVDYTLSNPPFVPRKLFWDFHVRAMETTRKNIYWLEEVNFENLKEIEEEIIKEFIKQKY